MTGFGNNALVVGGTSGIGMQTALALAERGVSRIVINGRDPQRGEAALNELANLVPSTSFNFIAADVSRSEGSRHLLEETSNVFDTPLSMLANCAGGDYVPTLFKENDAEMIENVVRHWLLSTMHLACAALPQMDEGSSIVNVASDAARFPTVGETVIGGALAGVTMFSRALAMEAKRDGIRINVVTPSLVEGTGTTRRVTDDGFSGRIVEKLRKAASLGVPDSAEVAALIVFLLGPEASKITGQVVSINGGVSAAL